MRLSVPRGEPLALSTSTMMLAQQTQSAARFPIISSQRPRAVNPNAVISDVRILGGRSRDGLVFVRLQGTELDTASVHVVAVTGGFRAELQPHATRHGRDLIVGVLLESNDDAGSECTLAFEAGGCGIVATVEL